MEKMPKFERVALNICAEHDFNFVSFIDSGAFKETYQIEVKGIFYALKVFSPNNAKERSNREIAAMKRITCKSVAQLYDVGENIFFGEKYLYTIEEFLQGGSLGQYIEKTRLSISNAIEVGRSIILALHETYENNIVHRDIKPDNIMFRGHHTDAVLVDFGLVRDLNESSLTQSFFMRGPGTPLFSAPEQLNNEKDLIDWRTDQFSLAVTLFIAVFGIHPFGSNSSTEAIDRMAAKEKCTDNAKENIIKSGITPLLKMLEPYPISRYRLPEDLLNAWNATGGAL